MSPCQVRFMLLLVATTLLACKDESTAPSGTSSTVTARVYVDADGSVDFTAGDAPVAGEPVRLRPAAGGDTLTAMVDDTGVVTFADVAPGNYIASFAGTPPAGAVLATAEEPTVTAPFQGGQIGTEFRFVYLPGAIAGQVYRDENANGVYDAGTDTPGLGMTVALFAGSGVSADTLAAAATPADGAYSFTGLRPGPYTVSIRPPSPTIQIVGDTILVLQVPPNSQAVGTFQFTGSLIFPIRQAKQDSGQIVGIEGVVIVAPGAYRVQKDNFYMQDTSSGVQVFDFDSTLLSLQLGDSVRVTGRMGAFGGERQIVRIDATTRPTVVKLGTGTVPAARFLTGAQIFARTFEGELAFIANAQLRFAPTGTSAAYNLRFQDAAGDTFTVRVETALGPTTVPRSSWRAGAGYNLTGALGSFNAGAQLKPRGTADIEGVSPIAVAKQDSGGVVLIEGVITVAQGTFRTANDNAYLQDTSGGVQLFNLPTTLGLAVGDSVRVAGIMGAFAGEREILRFTTTTPPVVFRLGVGTVPTPRTVTGAEIVARSYEGQIVLAADDSLTALPTGTSGAYSLTFRDLTTATNYTVRIESPLASSALPRSFWTRRRYDITGALGSFNNTAQLKPRGRSDVVP